jgi:cytochrome c peroxidase
MRNTIFFTVASLILLVGCNSETNIEEPQSSSDYVWNLPKGIYPPRIPDNNPITPQKVELGRYLFYDTRLSFNQTKSCSSCHLQEKGFADNNKVGIGATGEHHTRNAQSLTNAAYYTTYTWANPSLGTLETQIIIPLTGDDPIEMGVTPDVEDAVLARFETNSTYAAMFEDAFPDVENPVKLHTIVDALASFVRTLNSFNAPYDRYLRGDRDAMSASAVRGMTLFNDEKGECFHCHATEHFSDSTANEKSFYVQRFFHNIGLYNTDSYGSYPEGNQGLYELTYNPIDKGKFKTPSLRNVALSAPYMHDGSMQTLQEVVELHSQGGRNVIEGEHQGDGRLSPLKHDFITEKNFTTQEKEDLVAFLESLTDETFINDPSIANPFSESQ